jgi:hypothetical protein
MTFFEPIVHHFAVTVIVLLISLAAACAWGIMRESARREAQEFEDQVQKLQALIERNSRTLCSECESGHHGGTTVGCPCCDKNHDPEDEVERRRRWQ